MKERTGFFFQFFLCKATFDSNCVPLFCATCSVSLSLFHKFNFYQVLATTALCLGITRAASYCWSSTISSCPYLPLYLLNVSLFTSRTLIDTKAMVLLSHYHLCALRKVLHFIDLSLYIRKVLTWQ